MLLNCGRMHRSVFLGQVSEHGRQVWAQRGDVNRSKAELQRGCGLRRAWALRPRDPSLTYPDPLAIDPTTPLYDPRTDQSKEAQDQCPA